MQPRRRLADRTYIAEGLEYAHQHEPHFDSGQASEKYEMERGDGMVAWRERLAATEHIDDFLDQLERKPFLEGAPDEMQQGLAYLSNRIEELFHLFQSQLGEEQGPIPKDMQWNLHQYGTEAVFGASLLKGLSGYEMQLPESCTREMQSLIREAVHFLLKKGGLGETRTQEEHTQQDAGIHEYENERAGWDSEMAMHQEDLIADLLMMWAHHNLEPDIDFFLEVLDAMPAGMVNHELTILLRGNPERAVETLLARLDDAQVPLQEEVYSRMLYLLEVRTLPIEDGVVTYLEQLVYELPEGQSFDFAKRISADGKVGLFDQRGLAGYFELGKLTDPNQRRQVEVFELTRNLLVSNPDTPDAVLQKFFAEYQAFSETVFGEVRGLVLADLHLREQLALFELSQSVDDDVWRQVLALKSQYGLNGIRVLTSARSFDEVRNLLEVADKGDIKEMLHDHARLIEMADALCSVAQRIDGLDIDIQALRETMLDRSRAFFAFVHDTYAMHDGENMLSYAAVQRQAKEALRAVDTTSIIESYTMDVAVMLANSMGAAELRSALDTIPYENIPLYLQGRIQRTIETAYSLITPVTPDASAIRDLESFYSEAIQFESYEVNRAMNAKEQQLLLAEVQEGDTVLDLGCGTGRLTIPLANAGVDIDALDYSSRHVTLVQEALPGKKVLQGDWKHTGLPDASYDMIYSLGRNILHEYTLPGQVALFEEMARLLKAGGRCMIDIPNRDKGGYAQLVDAYTSALQRRGIKNTRHGMIYDSPDGQHFATRYAYAVEDIAQLAAMVGLEVVQVQKEALATGADDENIYITLQKREDLASSDLAELTMGPPPPPPSFSSDSYPQFA